MSAASFAVGGAIAMVGGTVVMVLMGPCWTTAWLRDPFLGSSTLMVVATVKVSITDNDKTNDDIIGGLPGVWLEA